MSLQPNHFLKPVTKSIWSKISFSLGLAFCLGGSSVNALPLSTASAIANQPQTNNYNFSQLLRLISQTGNDSEVIIDTDSPNSGSPAPSSPTRTNANTRFRCELVNGEYTVMYYPESQPNQAYPWAIPGQLGGGWTPERRCDEITRRLESYREDGLLELTTGVENNYNTICVTTEVDPTDCRIVLTVPPGQDPQLTRDRIFENLLIADDGQQTQGVYTYTSNGGGEDILNQIGGILNGTSNNNSSQSPEEIDLRPFLDPADGGTGERLQGGKAASPQSQQRKPAIFK